MRVLPPLHDRIFPTSLDSLKAPLTVNDNTYLPYFEPLLLVVAVARKLHAKAMQNIAV